MANCAVHPEPFTPPAMVLEDGGPLRRARCVVYIRGGFPKTLEDCVIAIINGQLSTVQRYALMHDISHYIVAEAQQQVRYFALYTPMVWPSFV
jgi:hypothetical protein